jgi:hypothetical protein
MSKMHRRSRLEIAMIAAALVLVAAAPADSLAAAEESSGGSTPSGTVETPGGSTQPAAPAAPPTELTPQGGDTETSSGGAAPIQRGSSVGSGAVPGKAEPTSEAPSNPPAPSEAPSYTPSSSDYEPEPSTPSASGAPSSPLGAVDETAAEKPTAPPADTDRVVKMAVGAATSLGLSKSSQPGAISSEPSAAAAPITDSGDQVASGGSSALPWLLAVIAFLILGFACFGLRRRRQRQRLEAFWRQQDAAWEAALGRAQPGQALGALEPSGEPLQQINVR